MDLDSLNSSGDKLPEGTIVITENVKGEDFTTIYCESSETETYRGITSPKWSFGTTSRNATQAKADVIAGLKMNDLGYDEKTGTFTK